MGPRTSDREDRDRREESSSDDGWVPTCPLCGEFIEACLCVCPFCGERSGCTCCIGYGVATGGD
jgi:hypothetical protein